MRFIFFKEMSSKSLLDEPIDEINVPVMQPSYDVGVRRLAEKSAESVRNSKVEFANWILSLPPEPIKKDIDERREKLKEEIRKIYSRYEKLTFYESEASMKGFLKTYRIDGEEGYDQLTFINYIRPKVIKFLSEKRKPFQVKFILTCRFRKGVSDVEEMEYTSGYFHSDV